MRPTKFGWGPDIARCIALPVPRDTSEAITGPTICMVNYNQFTERKITSETGRKIFSIWSTGIREGRNVLFCLLISTKPQHVINIFMKLVVALYYYTHNMSSYIIVISITIQSITANYLISHFLSPLSSSSFSMSISTLLLLPAIIVPVSMLCYEMQWYGSRYTLVLSLINVSEHYYKCQLKTTSFK